MATSGSEDFNQTRDEIIKDALYALRVLGADESVNSNDFNLAARQLNRMVKAWQAKGIDIWVEEEGVCFLTAGTESYTIDGSTDHVAKLDDVVETTLSADEASGQTILSVTSSTGMAASDQVGIELDDGTRQWTTIVSVDSATQITVTASLTGAAASGNSVYTYTTKIQRPLRITAARRKDENDLIKVLEPLSDQEYRSITDKDTQSDPSSFHYDPGLSSGKLYIWPTANNVDDRIEFTYARQLEDFDAANDNPDFPQEWLDALVWNLAVRLGPAFGKDPQQMSSIKQIAAETLVEAMAFDEEPYPVKITPGLLG